MANDVTPSQLIDYLGKLLTHELSDEIGQMYFGDIGVYPPSAFKNEKGENVAAIAISMANDKLNREHRSAAYDERLWTFDILVMISMIPYFEALPKEAYGERDLLRVVEKIKSVLRQNEMQSVYGRVKSSEVTDVDFGFSQRGVTANNKTQFTRDGVIKYSTLILDSKL